MLIKHGFVSNILYFLWNCWALVEINHCSSILMKQTDPAYLLVFCWEFSPRKHKYWWYSKASRWYNCTQCNKFTLLPWNYLGSFFFQHPPPDFETLPSFLTNNPPGLQTLAPLDRWVGPSLPYYLYNIKFEWKYHLFQNIRVMAKYYTRVRMSRMAQLLALTEAVSILNISLLLVVSK